MRASELVVNREVDLATFDGACQDHPANATFLARDARVALGETDDEHGQLEDDGQRRTLDDRRQPTGVAMGEQPRPLPFRRACSCAPV